MAPLGRKAQAAERQRHGCGGQRPKVTLPSSLKLPENEPDSNAPSGNLTRTFSNQQGPHQAGIVVAIIIMYYVLIFKYLHYATNPVKCHILHKCFLVFQSVSTNYLVPQVHLPLYYAIQSH